MRGREPVLVSSASVDRLLEALPDPGAAALAPLVAEVRERPLRYPLGSGQADEVALLAGLRPMLRQLLRKDALETAVRRFERLGLRCAIAPRTYGPTHDGWDDTPDALSPDDPRARRALWVGRDRERLAAAVACDLAKTDEADRELGRLLGYPACCVDAFVATSQQRKNHELVASALRATRGRLSPRLNTLDLAVFHFVSWYPCAYDCELSVRYADAVASALGRHYADFVKAIDARLVTHRLMLADDVQLDLSGAFDSSRGRVHLVSARPTACGRHPDATLDAPAERAVARLLALVRGAARVGVAAGALVTDERAWPLPLSPILAPFGEWEPPPGRG